MRRENYFSQDETEDDDVNALRSVTLKKKKLFLKKKTFSNFHVSGDM